MGLRFVNGQLGDGWEGGEKEAHQTQIWERVLHPHKQLQYSYWCRLAQLGFGMANLDTKPHAAPFPLPKADWKVSVHS